MGKQKKEVWGGDERRKGQEPYYVGDRRDTTQRVTADFVPTNNDERYQFENLVILYRARFNVWHVLDMKKPSYEQLLFEVTGYANQTDAFIWAKEYIKELKYGNGKKGSK